MPTYQVAPAAAFYRPGCTTLGLVARALTDRYASRPPKRATL